MSTNLHQRFFHHDVHDAAPAEYETARKATEETKREPPKAQERTQPATEKKKAGQKHPAPEPAVHDLGYADVEERLAKMHRD